MSIWEFIETKKEQCKEHKTVLRLLELIKLLIEVCINTSCIKCQYSFGTNMKKLNCQFVIKPKDIEPDNWTAFCDDFKIVEKRLFNRKTS